MPDELNYLAERYVRCEDEYRRREWESRVVEAAEPLIRSRCSSDHLTPEEREDMAQTLRVCVLETLRRWDPQRSPRFSAYLAVVLQFRAYDFIASSSRIGYSAERRFCSDRMSVWEQSQALALRTVVSLDDEHQTGVCEPTFEQPEEEVTDLFERIGERLGDPLVAQMLRLILEGQDRRTMRLQLRVSWQKLEQLRQQAEQLLQEWQKSPPEWLEELILN